MRILADENIHEQSVALLPEEGHDVRWVVETDPSTADFDLLELANREERTLITFDMDFGELVHKHHLSAPRGVVLFRIHKDVPRSVGEEFVARSVTVWNNWPPGIWTVQIRHHPGYPE